MTSKEKRAGIIGGLIVIGLGIAAIINPGLMEGAEASGRNVLVKWLAIYLWSRPGGAIAIFLGCGSIWNVFKSKEPQSKITTSRQVDTPVAKPDLVTETELSIDESKKTTDEDNNRKYAPPGYYD